MSRFPAELPSDALETVVSLHRPPGNVTVSGDGRVFFTYHPDLRPPVNVLEIVDGETIPYPSHEMQSRKDGAPFFDTVLSLRVDRQNRLWTLDHGRHGFRQPRLLAFDLASGRQVHRRDFSGYEAPRGSNLNDFQVDPSGRWIYIADASILRRRPAILVYDTEAKECRRVLEGHPSVNAEPFTPRVQGRTVRVLGLMPLRTGVDSIALDEEGRCLYYAPVTSRSLYRIETETLRDARLSHQQSAARVEVFATKPMSDGITMDKSGNVYLTAIEYSAVMRLSQSGALDTIIESPMLRWPDGFSFGPDGWLYVTCSALHEVLLKSQSGIKRRAPYHIFRFRPRFDGAPGR